MQTVHVWFLKKEYCSAVSQTSLVKPQVNRDTVTALLHHNLKEQDTAFQELKRYPSSTPNITIQTILQKRTKPTLP